MGKRTGGKRGAPFGNRNSVRHGRFTAARLAERRRLHAQLQEAMLSEAITKALMRLDRAQRAGVDIAQFGFVVEEGPRKEGRAGGGVPPSGF